MIKKNNVPATIWDSLALILKHLYNRELDPKLPQIITRYTKNVITINLDNTPRL